MPPTFWQALDVDVEGMESPERAFAVAFVGAGFAVLGVGDDVEELKGSRNHC